MTQTMKGLLKGLRYISQIFEADDEKEPEMEIGLPTDVKHVAHIGWEGPSSTAPSWMNEFQSSAESSSGPVNHSNQAAISKTKDIAKTQKSSEVPLDSPTRCNSSKTKHSKRNTSSNGSVGSPVRESSGISKPRRPKNPAGLDSPTRESSNRIRREAQNSSLGSSSQDLPSGPSKKSNRKKSKGSSGEESTRSTRTNAPPDQMGEKNPFLDPGPGYGSKNPFLDPEPGYGSKNPFLEPGPEYGSKNNGLKSVLEVYDEGKECDEISRGFRAL